MYAVRQFFSTLANQVRETEWPTGVTMNSTRFVVSAKEIESVSELSGEERYRYFVKKVADWGAVWGLWSDGWMLAGDEQGRSLFPMWPAQAYARACASGDWLGAEPREIPLDEVLDDLLPTLQEKGILPGVFFTPVGQSVASSVDTLRRDLECELERYDG